MYQFVETICIKDGEPRNLSLHVERLNRTMRAFFPSSRPITEAELLHDIPFISGLQKARVLYNEKGIIERKIVPYSMRHISRLCVVEDNDIDYSWKSTDRTILLRQRAKAPSYDEVVIVKNGCVTDTSYTNICFFDGKEWFTPDTPLLRGTMREFLLANGIIRETRIMKEDIAKYQKISLINAMIELESLVLPISSIDI